MAQLIKLQDYISRYEQDIYRYPSQYIRLKQQQWERTKAAFLAGELESLYSLSNGDGTEDANNIPDEKEGILSRMKGMFHKQIAIDQDLTQPPIEPNIFSLSFPVQPNSLEELKQNFLNQLLKVQLKWASSTIYEKSWMDSTFFMDEKLRFFLQRFPDTVLVLYKPIFLLKQAPVELEVILISPTDIYCMTFLEAKDDTVFLGSNERFWVQRNQNQPDKKVLNPMIAINRTEKIISKILDLYEVKLPIHKLIVSRNGYIDYAYEPYDITQLDKRKFPEWFEKMRNTSAPLKHQQLKVAQALLEYCQTTSSRRVEWDVQPNS